jgi:uncharacterized protein (DUF2252 family)
MRRVASLVVTCAALVALGACGSEARDPRESEIVSTMARADESLIRTRPRLVEGKYARMARGPYDFFRGTVPLFRHDSRAGTSSAPSRFGMTVPLVPSLGDPHPENFGALRASDGSLALEPNDFDAADRAPYVWDVRRFAAGLALAATEANADDSGARERSTAERRAVAKAGVLAYRDAIARRARGEGLERWTRFDSPVLADLASRANRDEARRRELLDLTVLEGTTRKLKRGQVDPEDPQSVLSELPPFAKEALNDTLSRYRATLVAPPALETLRVLDAAREYGSGVASFPRVRALVLVRGDSDDPADDRILEVKELADSGLAGLYPPGVYANDVGRRIVTTSRGAWARPDAEPHWGTSSWVGFPCQVRLESEGQKGVRVERMVGDRGRPEALVAMAAAMGLVLARVHTAGDDGVAIAQAISARFVVDMDGFVDEQADFGASYADRTMADHTHFVRALQRDGFRLGIPLDTSDEPSPDLRALYGTPPSLPPLP